jgi:trehalose synthase
MGRRGKEHVREHYLMPRQLRDNLRLYAKLLGL